nr:ankyrin repeat domain-containing protein [Nitrospirota bacterium]
MLKRIGIILGSLFLMGTMAACGAALHKAAELGDIKTVELLLNDGTPIDGRSGRYDNTPRPGLTPLMIAAWNDHLPIVRLLLDRGADINAVDPEGWTALHFAALYGRTSIVQLLLERKAHCCIVTAGGNTPLTIARNGKEAAVARLLVKAQNQQFETAPLEGPVALQTQLNRPVPATDERGVVVSPQVLANNVPIVGQYWALVIGIDKYQHVATLDTAVRDATAVRDTLIKRYGFSRERVIELLNEKATRANIEDALFQLSQQAGPEDSVFIYYAGHGQIDLKSQRGYWVPVEGLAQSTGTFVSNARIRDDLSAMQAKHVYLVADSCFSGTLFAKTRTLPPLNDKFFARLYETKSRWGLTSGMNEPVADQGMSGHSVFAYFFLKLLNENSEPYLIPSQIYDRLAPLVSRNADQQPRSQPLQGAGDEGGQFVFRLNSIAGGSVKEP